MATDQEVLLDEVDRLRTTLGREREKKARLEDRFAELTADVLRLRRDVEDLKFDLPWSQA